MAKVLANTQSWWAIAVRIYQHKIIPKDIIIWSKNDNFEILKTELIKVLEENGSKYKSKSNVKIIFDFYGVKVGGERFDGVCLQPLPLSGQGRFGLYGGVYRKSSPW